MSGRNAQGREVREFIAIGPNGSPISVMAYAPPPVSLGQLPMAGLTNIEDNSKAVATVVTTLQPHGLITGDTVWFASSDSLPAINGARVVTVLTSTTFSVPVDTSNANVAATITASTAADPSVVDTAAAHNIVNGATVVITGSDGVPVINGSLVATVIDGDTFTVPSAATQTFAATTITSAAEAVVTVPSGHLMLGPADTETTNVTAASSDSVPRIDGSGLTAKYLTPTTFKLPAVDTLTDQSFNITSASAASPAVFVTAAHLMLTGPTTVTVAGCDRVPDINGSKVATRTSATGFTIPGSTTASFTITGIATGDPTSIVTCAAGHSLLAGATSVVIAGTNSTPVLDGTVNATYIDATTFSVPIVVTGSGSAGTITYGRPGSATGTIAYHRAGTTASVVYGRPGTTGTVSYGHAGTTATTLQQAIISASVANPTVITMGQPHGLRSGDTVTIASSDGTPATDATYTVTVLSDRTFTIPVNKTVVGTTGKLVKVTYRSDVLDRGGATSGGALVVTPSLGHNTARSVKFNIQGSADGINWFNIPYALVATPRTFVDTEITMTAATVVTYLLQELIYWRFLSLACNTSRNIGLGVTATYVAFP